MKSEIRPAEASVLAVVSDEQFCPDNPSPDNLAPLKSMAESGQLFFLHTDDPSFYRLDVYVDESPPEQLDIYFTARSGSFLLRSPTGRLVVLLPADRTPKQPPAVLRYCVEVPAGDYVVSVRNRQDVDVRAHEERVKQVAGSDDHRFYTRLNLGGAVGCLAMGFGGLLALIPSVRRAYWPVLLLFVVPTLAYHLMTYTPRYRRVKELEEQASRSLPTYLLVLKSVPSIEGLSGGWYRD